tara:strand:+ start:533 stop:943 length:411 start_codon:yes stop_codon:yes gene_type:complete
MDKTKQQLNHIINDDLYWSHRSTSFKDVLISINGRKSLSQKQRDVIDKAIKTYTRYRLKRNNPVDRLKRENLVQKILLVQRTLYKCNYTQGYEESAIMFLKSVEGQAQRNGSISIKQVDALNKMYKRFKKKVEKST